MGLVPGLEEEDGYELERDTVSWAEVVVGGT